MSNIGKKSTLRVKVNGEWIEASAVRGRSLLDFIREDLNLTGTKKGCGRGDCGSCVVLINGHARTTCNLPVKKVEGQDITTIEGLARGNTLHPIQEALDSHICRCTGYVKIMEAIRLASRKMK